MCLFESRLTTLYLFCQDCVCCLIVSKTYIVVIPHNCSFQHAQQLHRSLIAPSFLILINKLILVELGLHCCMRVISSCSSQCSLVAEHRL